MGADRGRGGCTGWGHVLGALLPGRNALAAQRAASEPRLAAAAGMAGQQGIAHTFAAKLMGRLGTLMSNAYVQQVWEVDGSVKHLRTPCCCASHWAYAQAGQRAAQAIAGHACGTDTAEDRQAGSLSTIVGVWDISPQVAEAV